MKTLIPATARHLNGEPAVPNELVRAHLAVHGLAGGRDLTVAGLKLLTSELAGVD